MVACAAARGAEYPGEPIVHFLTAPMYLFDSADTIDKVHVGSGYLE
jgi:hypothetical protein